VQLFFSIFCPLSKASGKKETTLHLSCKKFRRMRKLSKKHQVSISSTFYELLLRHYFCAKKLQSQTVIREKLHKALLYEKGSSKMFMKLTIGGKIIKHSGTY
jgi:hypothetical protein